MGKGSPRGSRQEGGGACFKEPMLKDKNVSNNIWRPGHTGHSQALFNFKQRTQSNAVYWYGSVQVKKQKVLYMAFLK